MDLNSSFFFWAKEDLRLVFMNVSCEDGLAVIYSYQDQSSSG